MIIPNKFLKKYFITYYLNMADINTNSDSSGIDPKDLEIINSAENNSSDTALKKHLNEIRSKLTSYFFSPSKEDIVSSFRFLKAIKERKEALETAKTQVSSDTALKLANLKDELEVYESVQSELEKIGRIKIKTRNEDREDNFWTRIEINNYIIRSKQADWSYKYQVESFKEVTDMEQTFNNSYENLWKSEVFDDIKDIDKYLKSIKNMNDKPKETKKIEEEKLDSKKETSKWIQLKDTQKADESKINLPKDEVDLFVKYFWDNIEYDNIRMPEWLLALSKALSKEWDLKLDEWESLWYDTLWWTKNSTQVNELNKFKNVLKTDESKAKVFQSLLAYHKEWKTIISYEKESQKTLQFNEENIFDYLANVDSKTSSLTNKQIKEVFDNNNEKNVLTSISKIIRLGWWPLIEFGSKKELYEKITKDPWLKIYFETWLYSLTSSFLDFQDYVKNWWDTSSQLEKIAKFHEEIGIELDKMFDAKFDIAIDNKIKEVEADTEMDSQKKAELLANLRNAKTTEKESIRNFFKIKSVWVIGSLIKWQEWAWAMMVIWNNSANSIVRKIDIEVGAWSFGSTIVPVVWLSISWTKEFTDTFEVYGKAGAWIFWIYAIWGANLQINREEVENASFDNFKVKKESVWVAVNGWVSWVIWGATWWAWLTYNESLNEWMQQKKIRLERLLDKLDKFNNIKTLEEIDKLDLSMENKEEEAIIKQEFKNIIICLWFKDSLTPEQISIIISATKASKLADFEKFCAIIWEQEWFTFKWVYLWIQFVAWFFPIFVGWISAEKISIEKKTTKTSVPVYLDSSINHSEEALSINESLKSIWITVQFDETTWFYSLSPIETIKNKLNIFITQESLASIKIENDSLIIWKVPSIFFNTSLRKETKVNELFIWWRDWKILDLSNPETISLMQNNSPTSYITMVEGENTKKESLFEREVAEKDYQKYLESNAWEFRINFTKNNWLRYNLFRKSLSDWNFEKARTVLINFLSNNWGEKWKDQKPKAIEYIKSIKDEFELAQVLADFKDYFMVDRNTKSRKKNSQEEVEAITEELKGKVNPESLAKLLTLGSDSEKLSLVSKLTKEEKVALKKTNWWLMNNWGRWQNRKAWFGRVADKFLSENKTSVMNARQQIEEKNLKSLESWWAQNTRTNIFGLVATYKIANFWSWITDKANWKVDWENVHEIAKWIDAMPPGTVSIAWDNITQFKPDNEKVLLEQFASKKVYFDMVRKTILKNINNSLTEKINEKDFGEKELKELIENKKVTIAWNNIDMQSNYVFFMYGKCFNESVGIEFWNITVEVPWQQVRKVAPIVFWKWFETQIDTIWREAITYSAWLLYWKWKKPVENQPVPEEPKEWWFDTTPEVEWTDVVPTPINPDPIAQPRWGISTTPTATTWPAAPTNIWVNDPIAVVNPNSPSISNPTWGFTAPATVVTPPVAPTAPIPTMSAPVLNQVDPWSAALTSTTTTSWPTSWWFKPGS